MSKDGWRGTEARPLAGCACHSDACKQLRADSCMETAASAQNTTDTTEGPFEFIVSSQPISRLQQFHSIVACLEPHESTPLDAFCDCQEFHEPRSRLKTQTHLTTAHSFLLPTSARRHHLTQRTPDCHGPVCSGIFSPGVACCCVNISVLTLTVNAPLITHPSPLIHLEGESDSLNHHRP